jgi:hypothetical protein
MQTGMAIVEPPLDRRPRQCVEPVEPPQGVEILHLSDVGDLGVEAQAHLTRGRRRAGDLGQHPARRARELVFVLVHVRRKQEELSAVDREAARLFAYAALPEEHDLAPSLELTTDNGPFLERDVVPGQHPYPLFYPEGGRPRHG